MRNILLFVFLLMTTGIMAQRAVLSDPVSAHFFNPQKYSGVRGTPFLFDEWTEGTVAVTRGTYTGQKLKLDLYENKLYFEKEGQMYEFKEDVQGFTLMPIAADSSSYLYFTKGPTAKGIEGNQYVQVLAEGPISLYKVIAKALTEVNEINVGMVNTFRTINRYYVVKGGQMQIIRLTKKELLPFLSDREEKVQAFLKVKNVSLNKEADAVSLLHYYNTL